MRSPLSCFATTIVVGLLVAACASAASPAPSTMVAPSGSPPTSSAAHPTPGLTGTQPATPSLAPPPASARIPVRGSAREIGERVLMASGPGGGVFVSIPKAGGSVLALLDRSGRPRPGWPIQVADSTECGLLLPVNDGSVRVVCNATDLPQPEDDQAEVRAFAFDADGRMMAGWPVQLRLGWPAGYAGYMLGDELIHFVEQRLPHTPGTDTDSYEAWVTRVAANGSIRTGVRVPRIETACCARWAVGPHGVAYGVVHQFGESPSAPKSSKLLALDVAGVPSGFPVTLEGIISPPAFDPFGRIHLTVDMGPDGPTRTLVFEANGRAFDNGSGDLEVRASDSCVGIEGSCEVPAAPLVGPDERTFVIGASYDSTTVDSTVLWTTTIIDP